MKKSNKNLPKVYHLVREHGQGSISILAQALGKSKTTVSQTLRKGRLNFNNSYEYTEAINRVFGTSYSRDELFKNQ